MAWLPTLRMATFGRILQHVSCAPILRKFTLATVTLFALIVMSVSAALIGLTEPSFYFKFSALSLATSLMTLFTVIPMYVLHLILVRLPHDDVILIPSCAGTGLMCTDKGPFSRTSSSRLGGCVSFFCIAEVLGLTVSSDPLGSLVVERCLCRLDR